MESRRATFERAREFLYENGRWWSAGCRDSSRASPNGVVDALIGYRNADGGFGHALEPDKRCPESQPLDVQIAFETLAAAGVAPGDLIRGACEFLESVTSPTGGVPIASRTR